MIVKLITIILSGFVGERHLNYQQFMLETVLNHLWMEILY
jgi:hypothetical protein